MDEVRLPFGQVPGQDDEGTRPSSDAAGTEALIPSGQEGGITPQMRQHLDERIAAAGGRVDTVYQEISTQLAELESQPMPEEGTPHIQYQAARALLVAQLSYLEELDNSRDRG